MSDPLQHPTPTSAASTGPEAPGADELLVLYERACAEMQLAGRKLHRQMQGIRPCSTKWLVLRRRARPMPARNSNVLRHWSRAKPFSATSAKFAA